MPRAPAERSPLEVYDAVEGSLEMGEVGFQDNKSISLGPGNFGARGCRSATPTRSHNAPALIDQGGQFLFSLFNVKPSFPEGKLNDLDGFVHRLLPLHLIRAHPVHSHVMRLSGRLHSLRTQARLALGFTQPIQEDTPRSERIAGQFAAL